MYHCYVYIYIIIYIYIIYIYIYHTCSVSTFIPHVPWFHHGETPRSSRGRCHKRWATSASLVPFCVPRRPWALQRGAATSASSRRCSGSALPRLRWFCLGYDLLWQKAGIESKSLGISGNSKLSCIASKRLLTNKDGVVTDRWDLSNKRWRCSRSQF